MLQFVLTKSQRYPVDRLALMVIEGGCTWINVHLPDISDSEIRSLLEPEVLPMCREYGVIVVADDRPALATELGLHGVRLSASFFAANPGKTPASMRDELGPEAIIGVECADASALPALAAAVIDFVTVPASFDAVRREIFIRAARESGATIPVVAQGDFTSGQLPAIIAEGFSGVALSGAIAGSDDPLTATGAIVDMLYTD